MKSSHLRIAKSEELEKLSGSVNELKAPDELLELICNPYYEFKIGLSSRMLNYQESNNLIRFFREGTAGKRRFSLADALWYQFTGYLKQSGMSNLEIAQMNKLYSRNGENGITDWDLVVYYGCTTLGVVELWLRKFPAPVAQAGMGNIVEITPSDSEEYFYLSKAIRETFFNEQGKIILPTKTATILPRLVYLIDKLREPLGWEKLSQENFQLIREFGEDKVEDFIDEKATTALHHLPAKVYSQMYDIIHNDGRGNWYGIEIKFVRLRSIPPSRFEKRTTNIEELRRAIEDEVMFFMRMKERLHRGG